MFSFYLVRAPIRFAHIIKKKKNHSITKEMYPINITIVHAVTKCAVELWTQLRYDTTLWKPGKTAVFGITKNNHDYITHLTIAENMQYLYKSCSKSFQNQRTAFTGWHQLTRTVAFRPRLSVSFYPSQKMLVTSMRFAALAVFFYAAVSQQSDNVEVYCPDR